jgi:hypothetical protein
MSSLGMILMIKRVFIPVVVGMVITLGIQIGMNKLNFKEVTELISFTDKEKNETRNLAYYRNAIKNNDIKYIDARLLKPIDTVTNFNWSIYANIFNTLVWLAVVIICVRKVTCTKDELTTLSEIGMA